MIVLNLDKVEHQYGTQTVLEGVSWEVHAGQKIGLVGPNGAGKSTLLRIMAGGSGSNGAGGSGSNGAGGLKPDGGFVYRHPEIQVGYLAQEPALDPAHTVWEEVLSGSAELTCLEAELRELEARMADPVVYGEPAALERVLAAHARAGAAFERLEGYRHESRAREALGTLGLAEADFDLPVSALSGGQKKMVGLARLLVAGGEPSSTSLLLLDEPDNHLDLAGKDYMERFIASYPGTVILVSHDRYLLDRTVSLIAEIEDRRLTIYQGNYSAYAVEKQLRLLRQQRQYEAQQKEIARIEAAIARFEQWASIVVDERHIRQARSRQKMLERMDRVEKPVLERARMGLELNGWRGSSKVVEIVDLDKVFEEEQIVLAGLSLLIWHGERVGLLGANGAGKSVLFRCILGREAPTAGTIKVGPSVRIGYYAQEHETLDPDRTLVEEIRQVKPMYEEQAISVLGRFLFPYQLARKRVRELSGGERSRLQLAKLMLSNANFLLLDEPTNNLDLPSCEVLENALDEFEGTVLTISHDRHFLDRTVDRIVELEDGALVEYLGGYSDYAAARARQRP